ncbi:MAG TPA: hypothetical protein VK184_21810 [Nostocaceae cyanobacterium]|nr:hypothetical protein [Nostocaceae cyanobacterium]
MTSAFNPPLDLPGSQDIRVIGPRRSGKSTFMAALAYWPNADPKKSPIQSVDPYDNAAGELISIAKDILANGRELAGTDYFFEENIDSLPIYTLLITLKASLFKNPFAALKNQFIRIQISCRDYSGELMKDLRSSSSTNPLLNSYLDDCATATSLLLLIDGTSMKSDREYAQALDNLQTELDQRLSLNPIQLRNYRIAVVFTKCEQPDVWVHRQNINQFVSLKFPAIQTSLNKWRNRWGCGINYFFCSAFGTKGSTPQPNVKVINRDRGGTYGVIDKPLVWRPLGLVAPLYWLQTGQEDKRLKDI